MVAILSRASCFSLSKVSSSKAINLRTRYLLLRPRDLPIKEAFSDQEACLFKRLACSRAAATNSSDDIIRSSTIPTACCIALACVRSRRSEQQVSGQYLHLLQIPGTGSRRKSHDLQE